jgi:hypothetical protein
MAGIAVSGAMSEVGTAGSAAMFGVGLKASGVILGGALGSSAGVIVVVAGVDCGGVGGGDEIEGVSEGQPANSTEAARERKVRIVKNFPSRPREKQLFSACE